MRAARKNFSLAKVNFWFPGKLIGSFNDVRSHVVILQRTAALRRAVGRCEMEQFTVKQQRITRLERHGQDLFCDWNFREPEIIAGTCVGLQTMMMGSGHNVHAAVCYGCRVAGNPKPKASGWAD